MKINLKSGKTKKSVRENLFEVLLDAVNAAGLAIIPSHMHVCWLSDKPWSRQTHLHPSTATHLVLCVCFFQYFRTMSLSKMSKCHSLIYPATQCQPFKQYHTNLTSQPTNQSSFFFLSYCWLLTFRLNWFNQKRSYRR